MPDTQEQTADASPGATAPVIVTGMHRSGTSAVAGALAAAGIHFGTELTPAVAGVNDRGFFEDRRVLELHDGVLAHYQRDWRCPLPLPENWTGDPAVIASADAIDALIDEFAEHPRWGVKDPRLSLLLPIWLPLLSRRGTRPVVLITYRHPVAVAGSLARRDGLSVPAAATLWLLHMLTAELESRGCERHVVAYDRLMDAPRESAGWLLNVVGVDPDPERIDRIDDYISSDLRHHAAPAATGAAPPREAGDWQAAALLEVNAVFESGDLDAPHHQRVLDSVRERLYASAAVLGPLVDAQHRSQREWETHFAETIGDFDEAMRQLTQTDSALADQQAGFDTAVSQLKQTDDQLKRIDAVLTEQRAGFVEAMRQLAAKDTTIATLSDTLESARADLDRRAAQVETLQRQLAKRGTDDLRDAASSLQDRSTPDDPASTASPRTGATGEPGSKLDGDDHYRTEIDLRVDNNAHTRVIRYLTEPPLPTAAPILEVGCSAGYFGEALKPFGYTVWGVESDEAAPVAAGMRLEYVYRGDIESFLDDPAVRDVRFQAIVFGDVLEHLADPAGVLRHSANRLAPGGVIVASVPNVAHESVRLMLLEGRWETGPTGILDRTHLHFYTRDSLVELLNETDLAIDRLSTITLPGEALDIRVNPALKSAMAPYITDAERQVFQFVVLARPGASAAETLSNNNRFRLRQKHRILCLPPMMSSSLYTIRLSDPLTRLTEIFGGEVRSTEPFLVSDEDITWCNTVVLQRESNEHLLELMRQLRGAGKRVIFDIDDLLIDVPDYLSVAEHCRAIRPHLEAMLREVDAVSVSTSELHAALTPYNPNVFVTPNYAWSPEAPVDHYDDPSQPVRVIVASSDSVRVDFLFDSLAHIVASEALNVELVGIGPPGQYLSERGLPIAVLPLMPHEQFKRFISSHDNTIALIPLDDNRFNRCKSAIKFFDYALAGVPCICSAVAPYTAVIDHQDNAVLCADDEAAWTESITLLASDAGRRAELATAARARCVRDHNLDATASAWEDMLLATRFPHGDPVHGAATVELPARSPVDLLRGSVRHVLRPNSWRAAWRIAQAHGVGALVRK